MKKAANLESWLTKSIPGLAQDPERLFVLIEKGNVVPLSGGPTFRYQASVQVVLLDVPLANLDTVVVALIFWLQRQQPELLENSTSAQDVLPFQLEQLDRETCDFRCDLQLSELVTVRPRDGGGFDIVPRDEPDRDPNFAELVGVTPSVNLVQLFLKDDLVVDATLP